MWQFPATDSTSFAILLERQKNTLLRSVQLRTRGDLIHVAGGIILQDILNDVLVSFPSLSPPRTLLAQKRLLPSNGTEGNETAKSLRVGAMKLPPLLTANIHSFPNMGSLTRRTEKELVLNPPFTRWVSTQRYVLAFFRIHFSKCRSSRRLPRSWMLCLLLF